MSDLRAADFRRIAEAVTDALATETKANKRQATETGRPPAGREVALGERVVLALRRDGYRVERT